MTAKSTDMMADVRKETRAGHDTHVREMLATQQKETPIVSDKPKPQKLPEALGDNEGYVFTSRYDFQTSITVEGKKIPLFFVGNAAVVTQHHFLTAGITLEAFFKALVTKREYGRDFVLSSGPGYTPNQETQDFVAKHRAAAKKKQVEVIQGTRSTDREKK